MRVCVITDRIDHTMNPEMHTVFHHLSRLEDTVIDVITLQSTNTVHLGKCHQVIEYSNITGNKIQSMVEMAKLYHEKYQADLYICATEMELLVPYLSEVFGSNGYLECSALTENHIKRIVYGGNATVEYQLKNKDVISFGLENQEVSTIEIDVLYNETKLQLDDDTYQVETEQIKEKPLEEEEFIIVCGYGVESKENIERLQEYALEKGAILCGTKKVIDMGWLPPRFMIGQTGHTVQPKVCLTIGVSGAAPLVNGIIGSGTIISINKDPEARIFEYSDYGIIGDFKEVFKEE